MGKRTWTDEMEQYLQENWGKLSLETLIAKLGKTENAIKIKAKRLNLGGMYSTGDFLTARQVAKILNVDGHTVIDYWIKKCGLKSKKKMLDKKEMYAIYLENLMKWLENNKDKWRADKIELYALGSEPEWLKLKRKEDARKTKVNNLWTKEEENILIAYDKAGLSYNEMAINLNRTKESIERKLHRLRKEHNLPVRKILVPWTKEEDKFILQMDKQNKSDEEIAWELGREVLHVQYRRAKLKELGMYPSGNKASLVVKERAKAITKLLNKGYSCIDIAKKLNVHPTTISRNLRAMEG